MKRNCFNNQIKKLKEILSKFDSCDEVHDCLDFVYERISNRPGSGYDEMYNVSEILSADTYKEITKKYGKREAIFIEVIYFEKAPKGFMFIYNRFINAFQTDIDFYILKWMGG